MITDLILNIENPLLTIDESLISVKREEKCESHLTKIILYDEQRGIEEQELK